MMEEIRAGMLAAVFSLILGGSEPAQTVFVSPTGDDSNTGTSVTEPLRTFRAAADSARAAGPNSVVEFTGGEYVFNQTVVLDASYRGLTFRSAAGETPVFTSLVKVTGWQTHSGNIMVADLPTGILHVRYLHDASENWMERSQADEFRLTKTSSVEQGCL